MYNYSFAAEFLSLIISIIIFAFSFEEKTKLTRERKLFLYIIVLNIITIFLNLFTLFDMDNARYLPKWVNYGVNSLYYASCIGILCLFFLYMFRKLLCHVYETRPKRVFRRITLVTTGLAIIAVIINIPTGIVFYFTDGGAYCHGPLWMLGYASLAVMLITLGVCFRMYYRRIDYEGRKLLFIGIPVIFLLFVYQIVYPDCLLNGTMIAFSACLCYLCFESHSEEMDVVTKLGNFSAFLRKIQLLEERGKEYRIMAVNLKNYGNINVSYGFSKGNDVLYYLATWLKNKYKNGDIYRFAPVSFAIVLPDRCPKSEGLSECIQELSSSFPRKVTLNQTDFFTKPFFVELISDGNNNDESSIVEAVEYAIQLAKKKELEMLAFDETLKAELQRKKHLTGYIRKAMEEDRFEIWYQPIYNRRRGNFELAEALMRLRDEEGRFISPEEFIPVSEDMGLISQISKQALPQVTRVLQDAKTLGISQISLNLSMQQLQEQDYIASLFDVLEENGLSQDLVSYEVTERVIISKDQYIGEVLKRMTDKGHALLMDDFGTGYSNFSMVLDYPFQKIKIDKSLLYSSEKDNYKMITMLVKLFHAYGKEVVVEGAETEEQVRNLCEIGVDYIQGYYFARPMPEDEYRAFLLAAKAEEDTE